MACAGVYLVLVLFMVVTLHFRQRFALELGEAVAHDMRRELFPKLATLPMSFFNKTKFGRIISRMTSDIDNVRVARAGRGLRGDDPGGANGRVGGADGVVQLEALLADAAAGAGDLGREPALPPRGEPPVAKVQETWSRLTSTLAESVGGIRVTQAFVRQEINAGFFRKLVNLHGENNVGVARASAVFIPLLQMKSQLFLGAIALLSGYGALRWHGWLHMEAGRPGHVFFPGQLLFRAGPGDRQPV